VAGDIYQGTAKAGKGGTESGVASKEGGIGCGAWRVGGMAEMTVSKAMNVMRRDASARWARKARSAWHAHGNAFFAL